MKPKGDVWGSAGLFIIAIAMTSYGVWMVVNGKVGSGTHYLTQQRTGTGRELLILVGIILLIVAYLSLSPFSRVRKFFESKGRKKNRSERKSSK